MATRSVSTSRFRLVVALDRSEYAEIVLEHAIDQALRHDLPDVHVVTVVDRAALIDDAKTGLAAMLVGALDNLTEQTAQWRIWVHVLVGDPQEQVPSLAADLRADLLVLGRFGVHERRGSMADRMIPRATCPILVVNLKDDEVSVPQCAACVAIREATDTERLFCDEHLGQHELRLSSIAGWSSSSRGGSVW